MYKCTVIKKKNGTFEVVYVNELGIDIHVFEPNAMSAIERIEQYGAKIVKTVNE